MSIRTAIYDLMNNVETDVYPLVAPQELKVPYAVYRLSRTLIRVQEGVTANEVILLVNIYANDFSDCVALAATIEGNMEHQEGTYDSQVLIGSMLMSESDDYIPDIDKYMISQEYQLQFD